MTNPAEQRMALRVMTLRRQAAVMAKSLNPEKSVGAAVQKFAAGMIVDLSKLSKSAAMAGGMSEKSAIVYAEAYSARLRKGELKVNRVSGGKVKTEVIPWMKNLSGKAKEDLIEIVKIKDKTLKEQALNLFFEAWNDRGARIIADQIANHMSRGRLAGMAEDGSEYVVIVNGENPCPECEDLNGQIFHVNDAPIPPFHNTCQCTLVSLPKGYNPGGRSESDQSPAAGSGLSDPES